MIPLISGFNSSWAFVSRFSALQESCFVFVEGSGSLFRINTNTRHPVGHVCECGILLCR